MLSDSVLTCQGLSQSSGMGKAPSQAPTKLQPVVIWSEVSQTDIALQQTFTFYSTMQSDNSNIFISILIYRNRFGIFHPGYIAYADVSGQSDMIFVGQRKVMFIEGVCIMWYIVMLHVFHNQFKLVSVLHEFLSNCFNLISVSGP